MRLNKDVFMQQKEFRITQLLFNNEHTLFYTCTKEHAETFEKYDNVVIFNEKENSADINYIEHFECIVLIKSDTMRT